MEGWNGRTGVDGQDLLLAIATAAFAPRATIRALRLLTLARLDGAAQLLFLVVRGVAAVHRGAPLLVRAHHAARCRAAVLAACARRARAVFRKGGCSAGAARAARQRLVVLVLVLVLVERKVVRVLLPAENHVRECGLESLLVGAVDLRLGWVGGEDCDSLVS